MKILFIAGVLLLLAAVIIRIRRRNQLRANAIESEPPPKISLLAVRIDRQESAPLTYPLKLLLILRNDSDTWLTVAAPEWCSDQDQIQIQPPFFYRYSDEQFSGSYILDKWSGECEEIYVLSGRVFLLRIGINAAHADADICHQHYSLHMGSLKIPVLVRGETRHSIELKI